MSAYATQVNRKRRLMVDDVMTAYVRWREASARVGDAYDRWRHAARDDLPLAFRAYTAALDQEELACDAYADRVTQLHRLEDTRHQGHAPVGEGS